MKRCPACGGTMLKKRGAIEEPTIKTGTGEVERKARPATYYECQSCEHCEEKTNDN